jgi:hypothetical protein
MPVAVFTLAGAMAFGLGEVAAAIRSYGTGGSGVGALIMVPGALCFCWLLVIEVKRRLAAGKADETKNGEGS